MNQKILINRIKKMILTLCDLFRPQRFRTEINT